MVHPGVLARPPYRNRARSVLLGLSWLGLGLAAAAIAGLVLYVLFRVGLGPFVMVAGLHLLTSAAFGVMLGVVCSLYVAVHIIGVLVLRAVVEWVARRGASP